ncbi:MAG: PAP2 family protein, partial [Pontibacter sp.]|nr:PAP2 family protein [Pontibacter sp.]
MHLNKLLILHFLWLSIIFDPVAAVAQVQPKPEKEFQTDTLKTISAEPGIFIPGDTVLPGQKKPFTESQRLEGDNKRFLLRAVVPSVALIGAGVYTMQDRGVISSFDARDARNRVLPRFATNADDFLMLGPLVGLYGFNIISSQNRHELGRQTLLLLT